MLLNEILKNILTVFIATWWIVVPLALFFIFIELWLRYVRTLFVRGMSWTFLEIKIPKEILKTPKAMEQVFAAMHSIQAFPPKLWDKYWKGRVSEWLSFEIVGYSGGVHFFVRVPSTYRNLVEAAVYAQYPNAEIRETDDYTEIVPAILPNESLELFGTNFVLAKEDGYPIQTYQYFEAQIEEQRLDPIASLAEVMSKLKEGEMIWLQYLLRPVGDEWKKKGEEIIDALLGKSKTKKRGLIEEIALLVKNFFHAPVIYPEWPGAEKGKEAMSPGQLTYGKQEVIKAVENKIAKLGFETNIRFVYIDNRDRFSRGNIAAVFGAFRQFNTQHLNAFRPDGDTITAAKGLFKKRKEYLRKRKLFGAYKSRAFAEKVSILNTEELATIYHFPGKPVAAPMLKPIESKKAGPPPGLPIG
jgi:hemolysin-activating ACP:hemolysin acyltransferase